MGAFDFIGDFFNKDARKRAASAQHDAIDTYKALDPSIQAQSATDSFGSMDQAGTDAQKQAMGELQQEYQQGGMDFQAKNAQLQATMAADQDAASRNTAALNQAAQSGTLNSGRALGAVLSNNQAAANSAAMAGSQAASDASSRAQQALTQSAAVGSNLTGQAQQTAQGKNQAAQYNASNAQQAQEQTSQNELARSAGIAAGDQAIAATDLGRAQEARESAGAIGDAAVKAAAMGMADGGKVPGKAKTRGDSKANDTVDAKLSPGEIVIPRSVVKQGKAGIDAFVDRLLGGN